MQKNQSLLLGRVCATAERPELLQLAERLKIPVAASASGLGALPVEHPLSLGLVQRGGTYQANHACRQADVLLALGVRFDDRTSSSWIPGYSFTIPPTRLIHVDIDPEEIGRNYPVELGLMADVRTFLRQILAELTSAGMMARQQKHAANGWMPLTTIGGNGMHLLPQAWWMTAPRLTHNAPLLKLIRHCPKTLFWSVISACIITGYWDLPPEPT